MREDGGGDWGKVGFQVRRDEEWRFTNVSSIAKAQFSAAPSDLNACEGAQLDQSPSPNEGGPRLGLINGRYSPELSTQKLPRGIRATPLREANGTVQAHIRRYPPYQDRAPVALHTTDFHH